MDFNGTEELQEIVNIWKDRVTALEEKAASYYNMFNLVMDKLEIAESLILNNHLDDEYEELLQEAQIYTEYEY